MKRTILIAIAVAAISPVFAQRYMTRTGRISFFSSTSLENIEAFNNEASCVLDGSNGQIAFQVPVRSFKFEKELMQEHFNENYMESNKFPKAEFRGTVTDIKNVNFSKDGVYNVRTSGKLTIHGVTRDVSAPGTIMIKGGNATAASKFKVRTADYGIKIPAVVSGKVAQEIEVTVNCIMEKK